VSENVPETPSTSFAEAYWRVTIANDIQNWVSKCVLDSYNQDYIDGIRSTIAIIRGKK
jgi:hypothetical protein